MHSRTLLEIKIHSGMSYNQIAAAAHLPTSVVWRIITGRGNPTLPTAVQLASALGISVDELYAAQCQQQQATELPAAA